MTGKKGKTLRTSLIHFVQTFTDFKRRVRDKERQKKKLLPFHSHHLYEKGKRLSETSCVAKED